MIRLCSKKSITAILLILLVPSLLMAHGPSRKKITVEREINATPEKVWSVVGDFSGLHVWLPPVESSEIISGENNKKGAIRKLVIGDKVIEETLKSVNNKKMLLKYKISKNELTVLPVNNYSSSLKVKDNGKGGSVVVWKGAFYRGYPNNNPPPELNDEAAINAVTGLYNLGLDSLKKFIESK